MIMTTTVSASERIHSVHAATDLTLRVEAADLVAEGVSWFGAEIALDRTGTALTPKAS